MSARTAAAEMVLPLVAGGGKKENAAFVAIRWFLTGETRGIQRQYKGLGLKKGRHRYYFSESRQKEHPYLRIIPLHKTINFGMLF